MRLCLALWRIRNEVSRYTLLQFSLSPSRQRMRKALSFYHPVFSSDPYSVFPSCEWMDYGKILWRRMSIDSFVFLIETLSHPHLFPICFFFFFWKQSWDTLFAKEISLLGRLPLNSSSAQVFLPRSPFRWISGLEKQWPLTLKGRKLKKDIAFLRVSNLY